MQKEAPAPSTNLKQCHLICSCCFVSFSRKVKVVEQVLEKTRLQARTKTQEELDQYSDSDEDWKPDDDDKPKSLKERIDEKLSTSAKKNSERKAQVDSDDVSDGKDEINASVGKTVLGEIPVSDVIGDYEDNDKMCEDENDGGDVEDTNDNGDDLDSLPELEVETDRKESGKCGEEELENVTDEDHMRGINDSKEAKSEKLDSENANECQIAGKHNVSENAEIDNESEVKDNLEAHTDGKELTSNTNNDDVLFDWERNENSDKDKHSEELDRDPSESDFNQSDENKENIDPNRDQNQIEITEKPTTSGEEKVTPKNSASKKRKKIAALAGIDLDTVKPCLSGNLDNFISLEEGEEAPVHPGVQNLMDRLSKHAKKTELRKKKDTDIRYVIAIVLQTTRKYEYLNFNFVR